MKIKRFVAPDMRRAIQLVRTEHGPDAVILSTRSVEGGVEIVSALDYDQNLVAQITAPAAEARAAAEERTATEAPAATEVPAAATAPVAATVPANADAATAPALAIPAQPPEAVPVQHAELQAMQRELEAMHRILRDQFAHLAWADLNTFQPERAALQRRVATLALEPDLADALTADVRQLHDPVRAARELVLDLAGRVRVASEDPVDAGGVIALVGPTGVGKTTTIAKLAARHCLRHGAASLALISTDTYRVGAQRQLDTFGAILGVPVRRADSAETLSAMLDELQGRRLVLIDTAGMAPRDCRLAGALQALTSIPQLRTYLVLAANMQASVMRDAVRNFGGDALAGVALTKLDEANGLGAALSVLISENLPAVWLSEGQRVPEDLKMARPAHLIGWAQQLLQVEDPGPPPLRHRGPLTVRPTASVAPRESVVPTGEVAYADA